MGELGYHINFSIQLGTDLHPAATGQGRIEACLLGMVQRSYPAEL